MTKKGKMDWYFKSSLLMRILIGLILGAATGITLAAYTPEYAIKFNSIIAPFGAAFIRLLKMIIVPVVFFTLVLGSASTSPSKLGRVGGITFIYYIIMGVFAAAIGLITGLILRPGEGMELLGETITAAAGKKSSAVPMSDVILEIIPENVFTAFTQGTILQIIFFALVFGVALSFAKDSGDERIKSAAHNVFSFFEGTAEIMFIVVRWIMQYAPFGVFSLMVGVFALNGAKVLGPLVNLTFSVYIGMFLHLILIYGAVLALQKISIFGFLKRARGPIVTAFVTRSSGGTLPLTMQTADKMGISKSVYSFCLPVGATINMDGTTIYQSICAMFIANAVGTPLTFEQMVVVVITATLAAVGTAGVPGAGALMLLLVLEAVGLNVEQGTTVAAAYAMVLGIDAILDMGRTCLNVTGDIVGALFVGKLENELDTDIYHAYNGDYKS